MRYMVFLCLLIVVSGCQSVGNWADDVGSYMPVIGERCEHWQCFTEGGRAQSEYNKQMREQRHQEEQQQEWQNQPQQ